MNTSPLEAGLYTAFGLVFVIVACLILSGLKSVRILMIILILAAIGGEVYIVKNILVMQQCIQNVSVMKSALQKYNQKYGVYPRELKDLVPDYVKEIPVCPVAGTDTYSPSYKTEDQRKECSFCCKGSNHNLFIKKEDYPDFSSIKELKDRVNAVH